MPLRVLAEGPMWRTRTPGSYPGSCPKSGKRHIPGAHPEDFAPDVANAARISHLPFAVRKPYVIMTAEPGGEPN